MENIQATPAFDLTAILNAALAQAITQATAPLMARIELLERSLVVADKAAQGNESDLSSRLALLEDKFDNITTATDEHIKEIAEEAAREVLSEHNDEYDHDSYDRLEDKIEDKIDDYDFDDKIKDVLTNNLTLTVRVE